MKRLLQLIIFFSIMLSPAMMFSTHIVGGTLNYQHNGGSSYTITLKLFRDCGSGTASFPGSVTITVVGVDGLPFSPSKNITMNLGPVTSIPSSLPPCAQQPTPSPCTQQGIYTTTVNNLPPNPGGYHLYFQIEARNLSLTNVNASGNDIGESFYAYIPGPTNIWQEDFTLANGTTVDNGTTAWSIANGATAPASASVFVNGFQVTGANNGAVTWTSQPINIAAFPGGVNLGVSLFESGTLENNDSIKVYYRLNGGARVLFATNGSIVDDFTSALAKQTNLVGNTVEVIIVAHYGSSSPNNEIYRWDNVMVTSSTATVANSNPVFTLQPPLFLCNNQAFTFNHGATDADGDSLVYEFYTPYNGDDNAGGLDPTFPNNVATFTPITFLPGYSTNAPLGGAPLSINSSTGSLTGTPTILGQFVVGILVKEYRNGVLLSYTLRDFQFNVVNCPQTLGVAIGPSNPTICFGSTSTTLTASGSGGQPPYTYLWNGAVPTQTVTVGVGTFSVAITDNSGCQSFALVTVTAFTAAINANAGPDITRCRTSPEATITATVTAAGGGIWSGGAGTFSPNNTTLTNMVYTPSSTELNAGFANLILTTTGNGTCALDKDTVRINYQNFTGTTTPTTTATSCFGGTNGSATVNITGGAAPHTFSWSSAPNQTTQTATNLSPGTYTVTITDGIGCIKTVTTTVTQPPVLAATATSSTMPCNGGSVTATPTGGTPPYTYSWAPGGQTTATAVGLASGTYTCTITDSKGCITTASASVAPPGPLSVSIVGTSPNCFAGTNGSATGTVNGGLAPFSYSWSPSGGTAATATGLAAGNYTLTVTDSRTCSTTGTVTITQPTDLTASASSTNETCDYSDNGTATAVAGAGTPGYTYLWAPGGQTTATATALGAGSYTVTVTDSRGCTEQAFATVTQPTPISATFGSQTSVSCNGGSDATVTASGTGGTPGYTYSWAPGGQSTATATSLGAGTYTVTVSDSRSCTGQATVTITQPTLALSVSTTSTNVSCNAGANGTITATPAGGTAPYTYSWAPGGQTSQTAVSLAIGTYTVTVTDSRGCTATATRAITQPTALAVSLTVTDASCFGTSTGSITSNATGGTPAYTYTWTPGGQNTANVSGLAAGTYTLSVRDNLGCVQTASATVTQPATLTVNATPTAETCDYSNNGSAAASVAGGTPAFNYSWAPGGQTTATATNLTAGTYTVTVTDSKGCVKTATTTVTQPATLTATFSNQTNVSCNGGSDASVTATGTGGTPNYTYSWMPGALTGSAVTGLSSGTYTVTVTDSHACTGQATVVITQPTAALTVSTSATNVSCFTGSNGSITATPAGGTAPYTYLWATTGQTTQTVNGLVAGTYTVTVTDARGCTTTGTRTITQPTALNVSLTPTSANCFGTTTGSITSTVSGGTPIYTYSWTPGGQTTPNVSGLAAGSYTLQVRDNLNCTQTASVTVTQPATITVNVTPTAETCDYSNNGSAVATPAGGTAPYSYSWAPGGQTTATATNLTAGNYTVTVTDARGCVKTATTTVTQPATLSAAFSNQSNVSCNGGSDASVTATATGGTPNYTYSWMPGALSGSAVTGLSNGTYTVTVTDANTCTGQATVTITQPTLALSVSTSATNVSCFTGSNGSITATPAGGTAPYTYLWATGGQTTQTVNGLVAGSYTVTVTDAEGCTTTGTRTITQPTALSVSLTPTNANCFGTTTGSITSTVSGGTPAYTYSWTPGGQTTANISSLAAGSYTLQVRDNLNCTQTASVTVTQPATITVNVTPTAETCDYSNNGSAVATPAGGTPAYSYSWAPGGQTTATATNLTAGVYTVTVTDTRGCVKTATTTVTQPATLSAAFSNQSNVSCNGGSDASVTATGTGGTPNYTYSWMPGALSGSAVNGLASGTYTVTVTDANTCTGQATVTITQPTLALSVSTSATNVSCFGGSNGSITATPAGGTAPYTYSWATGGQTTQTINGLVAGTHTVTVTDAEGCTTTGTRTVTQPTALSVSLTPTNASCFGSTNGSINSTVSGGTPAYTFSWTPGGQTTANVSGLAAGSYTLQVRDNLNCTQTASVTITQPATITVVATPTAETCDYLNNGSATATPAGGTPAYSYLWAPGGQTTATATNLTAGIYTVTVTDVQGCVKTATTTVTQPTTLSAAFSNQVNVSCNGGNDASVTATGTGGTPNYTYSWMPGALSGPNVTGLTNGTYTVTVTDANTCTGQATVTITQPTLALSVSTSATNVSCFGGSNGSITATPAGGTAPYTYSWAPGGQTTQIVNSLAAGVYTVTVTDSKGCTTTGTRTITEPAILAVSLSGTNVSCFGGSNGSITSNVTGGTPAYTYTWSPGGQTTANVSGLTMGTYTVSVRDNLNCTQTASITITQPTTVTVVANPTAETCDYSNDGSATAVVAGGTPAYTYLWAPGGQTTATATNLTAGSYTVTVTDSKGCIKAAVTTVTQPLPLSATFGNQTNVSCFGGNDASVSATGTGGTPNYTYSWMPGGMNGANVLGLSAGTYTVSVTDAHACAGSGTVTITQPAAALSVSTSATPASCFDGANGTISANASGGTSPYVSYVWQPNSLIGQNISNLEAGVYTVTVTDSKNCTAVNTVTVTEPAQMVLTTSTISSTCSGVNGSASVVVAGGVPGYTYQWFPSGGTGSTTTPLGSGAYTVEVTDANGCTEQQWANINDMTGPSASIFSITDVTCFGGSDGTATAAVTGGTGTLHYQWTPTGGTGPVATGLTAGTYTISVIDDNGCESLATTSPPIGQPTQIQIGVTPSAATCFGGTNGSASVVATGGTGTLDFLWLPGGTTGATVSGLAAGVYTVQVTDDNSCVRTATFTITQPAASVAVSTSGTNATCFGSANGSASSTVTGGTAPYSYSWMPGAFSGQNISNIAAGTYTVNVTDAQGCPASSAITVTQPSSITINTSSTNSTCGNANGSATANASGGTGAFTYFWTPGGQTTSVISSVVAGTYTVAVTDANSCPASANVTINNTAGPVVSVDATNNVTCFGSANGTALTSVTGGTGTITYLWSPAGGSASIGTGLAPGVYTVTATDANGCTSQATTALVTQPADIAIVLSTTPVSCTGGTNGTITSNVTGGTPAYSYFWLPGGMTTPNITNQAAGTYTLQITDANTCVKTQMVTIAQPPAAVSVSVSGTNVSCSGGSNGTASSTPSGGTAPYSYTWMPGAINGQNIANITAGTYTVTVTDFNGCIATNSITITQPAAIALAMSSTNSTCGNPNGTASVNASGGTGAYTYFWTPGGQTTSTLSGVIAGAYTVQVSDANNCIATNNVTISNTAGPVVSVNATNNPTCFGSANGTATTSVTGGTGTITYAWSPSGGSASIGTGLAPGVYTVTATDANGCTSQATTALVVEPTDIFIDLIPTPVSCFGGNNGTITSNVTGGTPGYTYFWLPGGMTTPNITNQLAGTYTLQVTDANSCVKTKTVTITQPASAASVAVSATNVSCFGGSNGTASSTASGGTTPYSYSWMPGAISGQNIANIPAGTYTVTVTDFNGCIATNSVTITQPTIVALTTGSTNSTCGNPNGTASVNATGGTGAYTYFWTPGGQTTSTLSGVLAGAYTVQVSDANNCTATANVTISNTAGPVITVNATNDPSCFGSANGTATTSVTGGTGTITYAWSPSGGSASIGTGLVSGIYTVTATDANGCTSQATTSLVTEPTDIFIELVPSPVSCFGGNNGTVTSSVVGGTPGYTYFWLPGGMTTPTITNQIAGTYTLQVTDANSCVKTKTVTIAQPPSAVSVSATGTNVLCFGASDGTASSTASGGTAPYSYSWMPGSISGQNIANIIAGTYTVTVTDFNGCVATNSITITQPTAVALTTGTTNSTCGNPNGSATVNATGGTGAYTYFWTPGGQTTSTLSNVLAGTYTVLVNDVNNCSATTNVTINNTAGPVVTVDATNDPSCFGSANGTATTTVTGGTGTINYVWTPSGGSGSTAVGLTSGIYTVTVTDANGCQSQATTSLVSEPTAVFISLTSTPVSCFGGNDGTATSSVVGGTPGYTYFWLPGGMTTPNITNQIAGTYTLQVTDANSCVKTETVTITEPASAVSVSVSATNVLCFGASDGTASSTASGGTAPYTFSWMPGSISGQNIANIAAGTYTVTVTDFKGCVATNSITITQPAAVALTTGSTNSTCGNSNGSATVNATGGTGAYTYFWTPGGQTTSTMSGVLSGTYTVLVNDANSCSDTAIVTISNTAGPTVTVTGVTNVTCNGAADGTATTSVTGGTGTISYSWAPTGGTASTGTGLAPGIVYTVTATDINGCQAQDITSTITEPEAITVNVTTIPVGCFGGTSGSATAAAAGGTSPYTYLWLPGNLSGATVNGLAAGSYTVRATDNNGCIQDQTFTMTEPSFALSAATTTTPVSCFSGADGTTTATASGGTPPYDYSWAPVAGNAATLTGLGAGNYTVTVTDDNGCVATSTITVSEPPTGVTATGSGASTSCFGSADGTGLVTPSGGTPGYTYSWSPAGGTGQTASGLIAGNYVVTITDAKSCSTSVSLNVPEPALITGTLTTVDATCGLANGSIISQVTGGTVPYSYVWTPGGAITPDVDGLISGTYSVTVTDAMNCTQTFSASLGDTPPVQSSVTASTPVACFGGTSGAATVTVTQGTAPFTVSWLPFGGTNTTATGLTAGTYTAAIMDAMGCVDSAATVMITEPAQLDIAVDTIINVSCNGGNDGSVTVAPSGGTLPYSYSWTPSPSALPVNTGLSAGIYSVTVTDANSCIFSISMPVTEPTALTSVVSLVQNPPCTGDSGSVSVLASGGTIPYSYAWTSTPTQTGSTMEDVIAGTYTCTITDDNGCIVTNTATIVEPTPVITSAGPDVIICAGGVSSLSATATGGTGVYTYVWMAPPVQNGGTLPFNLSQTTTYTVTAFDQNGCAGTPDTIVGIVYDMDQTSITAAGDSLICPGHTAAVFAQLNSTNTGPLTYSWTNLSGNGPGAYTVSPIVPTTYVVTVTNPCGVVVKDSITVAFNPPPTVTLITSSNAICAPSTIQYFDASITGNPNDPIISWLWNFGDGSTSTEQDPDHEYTAPGSYNISLTVTTVGGCTNSNSTTPYNVQAYPFPTANFNINDATLDLPYDELICTNQSTPVAGSTYQWDFGDGTTSTLLNPHHNYNAVGNFTIQLITTTSHGCPDTAYREITTDADVVFPNVFTPDPNGSSGGSYNPFDNSNDVFFPFTSGVTEYSLEVFNRWGELIFESKDVKIGWDGYYRGKLCPQDVYIYKAHLKLNNGKEYDKTGDITLLQ